MPMSARGQEMIRIISVLTALASLALILRFAARWKRQIQLGMDDFLCTIAYLCMIGMLAQLILWCTIGGNGEHFADLDPETLMNFGKVFLANQFTYFILSPCIRASFIFFYLRLFTTRTFRYVGYFLITLIALWGTGIFVTTAVQCRPIRKFWDTSVAGSCIDGTKFFIVNQSFSILMDFIILFMPIPMIWALHRSWKDKIALGMVFAVGGFVCFASIYRIVALFLIRDEDETYTVYQATLWTHIEPNVCIICTCLPVIRGLFPAYTFPRPSPGSGQKNSNSSKSSSSKIKLFSMLSGNKESSRASRRSGSEYIKMADRTVTVEGTRVCPKIEELEDGHRVGKGHAPAEKVITVRTDIDVVQG